MHSAIVRSLILSIVGAAVTASGMTLDALNLVAPWGISWKWFELFGFLIFVCFLYWGWLKTHSELKSHIEMHPMIEVKPFIVNSKIARLNVKNTGHAQANFKVRVLGWHGVEVEKRATLLEPSYYARWGNTPSPNELFSLQSGDEHFVDLLTLRDEMLDEDGKEDDEHRRLYIHSYWMAWNVKALKDSEIEISLQVLSEPSLQKAFQKSFSVHLDASGILRDFRNTNNR